MDMMVLVYALIWIAVLGAFLWVLNLVLMSVPNLPPHAKTIILAILGFIAFVMILGQFGLIGPLSHPVVVR